MKRHLLLFAAILTLCALLCVSASAVSPQSAAEDLAAADMFRGTDQGFDLERAPTRAEAAVMLVRLYGAEEEALQLYNEALISHPFTDCKAWVNPYLAWLYSRGMVKGMAPTQYGADLPCSARDYALFLLRALGYQDGTDFNWTETEAFASAQNFYSDTLFGGTFTRGDMALMTWLALQARCADDSGTLLGALQTAGTVAADAARTLTQAYQKSGIQLQDGMLSLSSASWQAASSSMEITIHFEDGDEVLDAGALRALVKSDTTGRMQVLPELLDTLVSGWASAHGTYNTGFRFDSYVKGLTTIDFIKCDYRIDEAGIKKQLLQAIASMESAEIQAPLTCYRYGVPFDISQTHVEVDIDNQQLTFIKNGTVLVNTNIVTGMIGPRHTPTGLYYAHNRQTNCTLVGADFRVFVKYWVSVIENVIGLHDASWRSAFGGDLYVNNGSHGCVNIPEAAMAKIFYNIDDGTPVLIHGRNEWYEPGSADSPATQNPLRGTTAK